MIATRDTLALNRSQMVIALDRLRQLLKGYASAAEPSAEPLEVDPHSVLAWLCSEFKLGEFERDVLILAAAAELDGSFPALFGEAAGDASRMWATLSLALAAIPNPTWSALLPNSALREWRLIEIDGPSIVSGILRTDEAVLHALLGFPYHDARLRAVLIDSPEARDGVLSPAQQGIVDRIGTLRSRTVGAKAQLICTDRLLARAIARHAAEAAGLRAVHFRVPAFPAVPPETLEMIRLCERAIRFMGGFAVFECSDGADQVQQHALSAILEHYDGSALILTEEKLSLGDGATVTFDVQRPTRDEQGQYWERCLPETTDPTVARLLAAQFDVHFSTIESAVVAAEATPSTNDLWDAVRMQARPRLDTMLERVDTAVSWRDLILPPDRRRLMRQIVNHVRYRDVVYGQWGFDAAGAARGMTVLFVGASGTGKSLAARVIANVLRLDLYRVDLSAVFNKYIGETEKNLRRIFDAAETGGVVLVFDEADALFGKRSDVKDSHDRHANVEVSYLLQRLERFNGIAVLTSNLRDVFDAAFMRRFAFVVDFPFPDAAMRKRIWKRAFPQAVPTDMLDHDLLAKLPIPGGNISNIALNAAVFAASRGTEVNMSHVAASVRLEYAKLDRSLHDPDLTRWLEAVPRTQAIGAAV